VELRNDDYSPAGPVRKISAVRTLSAKDRVHEIVLDGDIPEPKGEGFLMFDLAYKAANLLVRDCYFHDNRARALLFSGKNLTVENCRFFHNSMGAISVNTGYAFNLWTEGRGASNVVIRNNIFDTINPSGEYPAQKVPAIRTHVYRGTDPSGKLTSFPLFRDILIEGNTFKDCPGVAAYICASGNVIIRGNTIVNTSSRRKEFPFRGAFTVTHSSDIFVDGNKWIRSPLNPGCGVFFDIDSVSNIYSWGNRMMDAGASAP
jgi:hypothetical protein